jgi:hypothetical protein
MTYPQYGIYLIPPPELVYPLSLAHQIFIAEFNTQTASRFMVHCTIKGFFKMREGSSPSDLISALDDLFNRTAPFDTTIRPPWTSDTGPGAYSILLWLEKTPPFQKLHNDIWSLVFPHVAPDCLFTPKEPSGPNFPPHLSLVQSDFPQGPGLLQQGLALAQHIYDALPTHSFHAQDLQLIEFTSDDWAGDWWHTLRFHPLKAWRLRD